MADIGTTLREARIRARIDMSEVEARTKIRAKYLRAIENEEWNLLPGPVYVKSFLRTYGDFLGLDSRLLVDDFKRRYERPDQDMRPVAALSRERERAAKGPLLPPWAIIGDVDRLPDAAERHHAAAGLQATALRMTPRAGILVTGTEVLTGIISDRNGPWLSERLRELGVDAAMIEIVGDRPDDLLAALEYMASRGMALIV